ncbi:hypothetical protein CSB45_03920 [candidate division KSB3 bacterium]|uniref:Uncharacterized protein n=1 Tax=candidate division KSB3 bacterium TaxID=2044937 RepID=A0A2G6E853_9BACT|nr:MAG: hypothetical protein CSB45_03920 [candidate division KSB3 bacterium]PIE30528.1 MAG: hypothetical protein CSA57_02505 [candidate division KSB3 bacterium]
MTCQASWSAEIGIYSADNMPALYFLYQAMIIHPQIVKENLFTYIFIIVREYRPYSQREDGIPLTAFPAL